MTSPDVRAYLDLTLFDRTAQAIFDTAKAVAVSQLPDWVPAEGNTEVVLLESLALEVAELVFAINRMPGAITEVLLRLFGLTPTAGAPATATVTFQLSDALGHEIPIGTRLRLDLGGSIAPVDFTVDVGLVVAPTFTSGTVAVTATEVGVRAHGGQIGNAMELLASVAYVDSAVLATAPSAGRVDESPIDFLSRGVEMLSRLVTTLVLPEHFTSAALTDENVYRATTIDNYSPDLGNEKQEVSITGGPDGGSFTLTFSAQTTGAIDYDATAAEVQTALEALSNIDVGEAECTGGPLPATPVLCEFRGRYGGSDIAAMTYANSLTGGSSPTPVITTTQEGNAGPHAGHVTVVVAGAGGALLSSGIKSALEATLESQALANLDVHLIDPAINAVAVTATVQALSGQVLADVEAAVIAALNDYLNPDTWLWSATVRYNELISLLDQVVGVDYVVSLTVPATDVTLSGVGPLVDLGATAITVT